MKITITKTRDVITPDLKAKLAKARNPKKALEAMGLAVVSIERRAYTQATLRPATWEPLKPATIKAKKAKKHGSKPLIAEGTLSISSRVISATSKTVSVGSDRRVGSHSLAAIHQHGTKDGHIPARPTWPFDKQGRATERGKKNIISSAKRALAMERQP